MASCCSSVRSSDVKLLAIYLLYKELVIGIYFTFTFHYHYFVAITQCYGIIYTSVTDFLRGLIYEFCGPLWVFAGIYGFVTHSSDVTVHANAGIVGQN